MKRLKVEGHDTLVRDVNSKAIINTSKNDFDLYMKRIKAREQQGDSIRNAVKEINILKQDIFEIKNMLKNLGKK